MSRKLIRNEAQAVTSPLDDEGVPGETMDEFMGRKDEEDAQWRGKQGGRGASKHDANESRTPPKFDDDYDPHMGAL